LRDNVLDVVGRSSEDDLMRAIVDRNNDRAFDLSTDGLNSSTIGADSHQTRMGNTARGFQPSKDSGELAELVLKLMFGTK
jgi:hypothetical protein